MMVTFISQCEKNALNKTRRVLDAFANRIGDNTWQTVITEDGLNTVKKMLRQTASKSTAVSCHWLRSRSRSQLLWVVGNKSKFDAQGVVPVNSTGKATTNFENDWHSLPQIKALAALVALLHDWGKASALFQKKLQKSSKLGDPIRHEWISCLLFHAAVQISGSQDSDTPWLTMLINDELDETKLKAFATEQNLKLSLDQLPPAAKLLAWLIVSHHRLPNFSHSRAETRQEWLGVSAPDIVTILKRVSCSWGYENRQNEQEYKKRLNDCFAFPNGFLSQSAPWTKQLKKWAQRLLDCLPEIEQSMSDGSYRLTLHHTRLCLMLGDHFYSSQMADKGWQDTTGLFANTDGKDFKQKLDEHLVGVAKSALRTAHLLPRFEHDPPEAQGIIALKKASPAAFEWQNKAVDKIQTWRKQQAKSKYGFFAVNMASTGCGKTFANAKVMRALSSDGDSLRYILALGLRTLTLQTGDEYRQRIGLDNSELAVLIGSRAVMELHNQATLEDEAETEMNQMIGAESLEPLLSEDIDFDCDIPEEGLATVLKRQRDRQFLYAPVLACTIDHLMAATETRRGGRYMLPSLRLMSSDLVIDEVDDFTGGDLIAIGRLIHLAGMLGRKVMISSATIPPDLAEGYFHAYQSGWRLFSKSREASNKVGCAWIDEFKTTVTTIDKQHSLEAIEAYRDSHRQFIEKRVEKLRKQPAKRRADIIECRSIIDDFDLDSDGTRQEKYFSVIQQAILEKHRHHHTEDQKTGIKVSFGVVRMANITPCVALSNHLMECAWPGDADVKVMAYHSQQVLLLRHEQEKHLDRILKRNKEKPGEQPDSFNNSIIRSHLDNSSAKNMLFIVVATPVEEVGRDHDFDWAIVEPSSYRSIIQLAGRVRRHREGAMENPNIGLLQYNWRAVKGGNQSGKKYYCRPGYEENQVLDTHDLSELIDVKAVAERIDAIPRIRKSEPLNYRKSLVDLEHLVTQMQLANYKGEGPDKLQGYLAECWYLTALPQVLNPFRKSEPTTKVFLMYEPDKEDCVFVEKDEQGFPINRENILQIRHQNNSWGEEKRAWLHRDYEHLLAKYAEQQECSKRTISLKYGELSFVYREGEEYEYSDQFGLVEK